jgi:hypothetical protein
VIMLRHSAPEYGEARRQGSSPFTIEPYHGSRHWAVYDSARELVCLTVYKRGAVEVVRRLEQVRS